MSNYFCINKSGQRIPVYSEPERRNKIGEIYDREAFGYDANWGGDNYICHIVFLNPAGKLSDGFIVNSPNGAMADCSDYPYGRATIYGRTYRTFIMRRASTIYKHDGTRWGTVAKNCRVAFTDGESGASNPHWKEINYVESSSGAWVPITTQNAPDNYGYVDSGLSIASGYKSIPMYGSW